jgi:hypothetical protein
MFFLYDDIFTKIHSFLTFSSLYSLKFTSKRFCNIKKFTKKEIKRDAIIENNTEIFRYFFSIEEFTISDFILAAENNNLNIIKWACSNNNILEIIKNYSIEIQKDGDCSLTIKASQDNNLDMWIYLTKLGFPYDNNSLLKAIENNNMIMTI